MQSAVGIDSPLDLIGVLQDQGLRVIAPQERDGVVVYDVIDRPANLPRGLREVQAPGSYRLTEGDPDRWFDYTLAPSGWKAWLYPARRKLWAATRDDGSIRIDVPEPDWPSTAFFGVRPCELAAIGRLDGALAEGAHPDDDYLARRQDTLIVVVQCARSAETCFCASMDTGPRADAGFDLALTELGHAGDHPFLLEAASERGAAILAALSAAPATERDWAAARAASQSAADAQTRRMPEGIAQTLADASESPHWRVVAERCLSCANCTMACPTCFCSDVEDTTDLTGDHAERWQSWDSCFSLDFSLVHGGPVRQSPEARYRQWMTHKLSYWHDQFGSSGCVGCGRCIAWCPVGIDITAEAEAIMAREEA